MKSTPGKIIYETYQGYTLWKTRHGPDLGSYEKIVKAVIERLEFMTDKHSRVLATHFTLTFPRQISCNEQDAIRRFIRDYRTVLYRCNFDPQFVWCIEKSPDLGLHLHFFLYLDGNLLKSSYNVWELACNVWSAKLNLPIYTGYVSYSRQTPYRRLERGAEDFQKEKSRIIEWGSYLAKVQTKHLDAYRRPCWDASEMKKKGLKK